MAAAGQPSGLVIQALRYLGHPHVTAERIADLRRTLPLVERRSLIKDIKLAPIWMHQNLRDLAD